MFYLKIPSLIKIRYTNNQITWGDDSMLWWMTPKSGIMRLQNIVEREAAREHGGRKYIKFGEIILLVTHWWCCT